MSTIPYVNDGSDRAPHLKPFLNMGTLNQLPASSSAPCGEGGELYAAIKDAGFEGVQGGDPRLVRDAGLIYAGGGRINAVGEADELCRLLHDQGAVGGTLHVMWGMEDDDEVDRVIGDILDASARHAMPLYVETHRATVTQDIWRTVKLVERLPDVRFNGDFSHWYTGLEMRYGGVEPKLDFAAPVLERVGFMHGRIGNAGCMQVDIGDSLEEATARLYVQHFMEMWTRACRGFKAHAGPGDYLPFAPELLQPEIFYARTFPGPDGQPREESDRWRQALLYLRIVQRCFDEA